MNTSEDGADGAVEPGSLGDKAARVFEFLVELQRLRTKVTRDLASYRSVLWYADLPDSPRVASPIGSDELGPWLAVDRVERERPPAPPQVLAPWVTEDQLRASDQPAPALSPRILRPVEVLDEEGKPQTISEELLLVDHPEVEGALATWLPEWSSWAAEDRQRRVVAERYQQLYDMYQASRASAETYELLLCFGLLRTASGGQAVRRHLLVARAAIELDLTTGRLTVEPAPDDAGLHLEQDMLDPVDTVPEVVRLSVQQALSELPSPWARGSGGTDEVLRTWVNGLDARATYDPGTAPTGRAADEPTVAYAPAVVLRERTRRSFIAAGEQIAAALRAGAVVPTGVRKFIEIGGGQPSEQAEAAWSQAYADGEVYFPKPANHEQRQIVERLSHTTTLVVQGPPGTGKTHTIANLITDMLAHGQRVLITSTTTRALRVLKGQLPAEVADLCVSVTDDPVRGQADLERSVDRILQAHNSWDVKAAGGEAAELRRRLASARGRASAARQELLSIREQETYPYAPDVGDYHGTLAEIADRLSREQERLGWLGPVPDASFPLSAHDAHRFLHLLRRATSNLRDIAGRLVANDEVVSASAFEDLCARRREIREWSTALETARRTPAYAVLRAVDRDARSQLCHHLREVERLRQVLQRAPGVWVPTAVLEVLAGRDRTWRAQFETSSQALLDVDQRLPGVDGRTITGLDGFDLDLAYTMASDLARHLSTGGKLRGLFGATKAAKDAAPFLDRVRVDGQRCDGHATLEPAWTQVVIERALQPQERFFGFPVGPTAPVRQRLGRLQDELEVLTDLVALAEAVEALRHGLRGIGLADIDPRVEAEVQELAGALDAVDAEALHQDVERQVRPSERALADVASSPGAAPCVSVLHSALGAWDPTAYRSARSAFDAARDANAVLEELARSRAVLAEVLPDLVDAIERAPFEAGWSERLSLLPEAWAWSVWDRRVAAKTDPAAEDAAWRTLTVAEFDESHALRQLAGNRGWAHSLERLTDQEATHLKLYAYNIRKVGKGTGKNTERFRAEARKSLRLSQTAVPAWIMPMHQVFETVPMDTADLFDVIIVDEASQSGLEGLLLSWLAPRIVVVGDDKQVSPSNVGLDHEQVFNLQDRYLGDLSTRSLFGPQSSLFDQAVGMARARLMLKEHFRCMPEIIGFSNELCYDRRLLALRQYGAERLPPLRTTYVRGAMVSGSGSASVVNEAEAEALVEQLVKCSVDPLYESKTFGVITLLGNAQDKLLTAKLVDALGVQEVEARRLRVSNPEGFQGDERDVIFISMVSSLQAPSGPARIGPLSKESDQQRINVAASRARDQVWLFHSVQPGDLSTKDLRRQYLEYFLRPVEGQAVGDLGEVLPDVRHPRFDSLFEQRVYLQIRARGYRVQPQVRAGRYRIDLVVEGGTQRLAVECDGDAFHGVDVAGDDVARQRDLERVGWTFWRVRGSAFARDPHSAMQPLWRLLDDLGIESVAAEAGSDGRHQVIVARATAPTEETPASVVPDVASPSAARADAGPRKPPFADSAEPPVAPSSPSTVPGPRSAPKPRATAQPAAKPSAAAAPLRVSQPTVTEPAGARPAARPRLRAGKVLVTQSARTRVEQEIAEITAWLEAPPPIVAVDDRSRRVQEGHRDEQRERMEERLDQLKRVIQQSAVEPHAGGQWVTPGSLFSICFGDETVSQQCVISVIDDPNFMHISPFSELGRALEGAELGVVVEYEGPKRRMTVTITAIQD
jgi:very-short-patch-repair endonuclease/transcription elongation GreA/GreB family factor